MTVVSLRKTVLGIYDFVVCLVGAAVFAVIFLFWSLFAMLLRPLLSTATGREIGRSAIMRGFRLCLGFVSLSGRFHFELSELDALRGERSLIIACNHPSLWDVVLITSRLPDLACVMKAETSNNLFLGGGARLACYIHNQSVQQMIRQAVRELLRGSPLLLFPEGTRTVRYPINPLKRSIGIIAVAAKASVQTVFIETNSAFLTKHWPLLKKPILPMTYRVRLGHRFSPPKNARLFVAELEQYFIDELGRAV